MMLHTATTPRRAAEPMRRWLACAGLAFVFGGCALTPDYQRPDFELPEVWVEPSFLFGCSPVGTLAMAWRVVIGPIVPGLIVQWVVAGVMVAMAVKAERREISRRRGEGLSLPGLRG